MAAYRDEKIIPRAGLVAALAAVAFIALAAGTARAQGNAVTFPPPKFTTWTIPGQTGDAAKLTALGDTVRFIFSTTGANTWMRAGNLWHMVDPTTEQGWQASWSWPGGKTTYPRIANVQERYGSVSRKQGFMLATKNWIPPAKSDSAALAAFTTTAYTLSPLPYNVQHGFRGNGSWGSLGVLDAVQINRYPPSQIIVNGVVLHDQTDQFGSEPGSPPNGDGAVKFGAVRGVIDETLPSHRAVYDLFRFQMGVDIRQTVHGWAINNAIDSDYLLYEFELVNTGAVSRRPLIAHKLPLEPFIFSQNFHARPADPDMVLGTANDDVLEWFEPWPSYTSGGVGHQMVMFYDGDRPGAPEDWGGPGYSEAAKMGWDLWAKQYTVVGWIFAESTPGSGVDDPAQPRATNWTRERDFNLSAFSSMQQQYQTVFATGKTAHPTGADDVPRRIPNGILDQPNNTVGVNDPTPYQGLYWNTFPWNSQLRAVMVVAAGGLNHKVARDMARTMIRRRDSGQTPVQTPEEITYIKTGRDSVKRTLDRAFWNIYGYDPNGTRWVNKPVAYNQAFNVPDPPAPSTAVWMTSGPGKISVQWAPITDAQKKDPDTGVSDFVGYRVYRATGSPDSDYVKVYEGPDTKFEDTAVSKDFVYFYYVTSFDDGSQNYSTPGVRLESGKFWLWNGWYDAGVRPSGRTAVTAADLPAIRVVPNPYNVRLNFPAGAQSTEIVWKGLPETCTIRVYTSAGDFVKSIDHSIGGSEPWDLRTDNNQYIATGVYIYTVDSEIGSHVGKFVVIR